MNISFKQIKYFVATAELGQVSRAAIELSVSQSAITAAIKDLEHSVGGQLFQRTARGMALTATGRRFLDGAYRILRAVDDALQPLSDGEQVEGELSVAATYTMMGYFLPSHLERLQRMHPGLQIHLHELTREMIEEGLIANRFDVALLLTNNVLSPQISTETLMSSQRRLWLPTGHPLLSRESVGFEHIASEPYIMLTVDEEAHTTQRYWNETGFQPTVSVRTSSIEAVRSMVANGQGLTILSDMVYRPWSLEGRRLETLRLNQPVPSMDLGLAWRSGKTIGPAMKAFMHYFSTVYQTPQRAGQ